MKLPKITSETIKEIRRDQKQNFKERLEFTKQYAKWVKKTTNKVWSSQQKKMFD